jgi:hypothetical protein
MRNQATAFTSTALPCNLCAICSDVAVAHLPRRVPASSGAERVASDDNSLTGDSKEAGHTWRVTSVPADIGTSPRSSSWAQREAHSGEQLGWNDLVLDANLRRGNSKDKILRHGRAVERARWRFRHQEQIPRHTGSKLG